MVQVCRRDGGIPDPERLAAVFVDVDRGNQVTERDREVVGLHLAAEDRLQRLATPGRAVDVERRAGGVGRDEEREALDVIPVGVADEQMDRRSPPPELLGERETELPDPGPRVEYENVLPRPDLDARRVASVERRGRARGGDGSAGAPEGRGEPGGGPVGAEALHAGDELLGVEGLHHVVVRAHFLGAVDVRLVRLRRDHHHDRAREPGVRAQAPEHLEAVDVVHDDVGDDDAGTVGSGERDPLRAPAGGEDREALTLEDEGQQLQEPVVVVDDEQGLAGVRGGARGGRRTGICHQAGAGSDVPGAGRAGAIARVHWLRHVRLEARRIRSSGST